MKILHVTPHLGGGVGKAHAALSAVLPYEIEQTYLLLEEPRNRRYVELIEDNGARIIVADNLDHVAQLAAKADIVQFEFWNHPRLFECLARCDFPAMRSVFWSHISGLSPPLIPQGLMESTMRFVFTTEVSRGAACVSQLSDGALKELAVINSGFGFANTAPRVPGRNAAIAYLGTVDFVKMHPGFFDAIDSLTDAEVRVSIWGTHDPLGDVAARANVMRHPKRITFHGETADPRAALCQADIFFYPLQPDHYGTAENVLIEAMSLGLVPVVMDNPAERAIIRDGENGFIARSIDEATSLLQMLLNSPDLHKSVSRKAIDDVACSRTPDHSARDFMILWLGMLAKEPQLCDFRAQIGDSPAEWFAATQGHADFTRTTTVQHPSKGSLAHFESVFAGDASLARLRR
jgi:glycosyltransferase involved in cell wall biosynthesis